MRLIDADAFERKVMCGDEEDVQDVIYSLRDFPTAYNVDKVMKQLEKASWEETDISTVIYIDDAIEIVKQGGVNHN